MVAACLMLAAITFLSVPATTVAAGETGGNQVSEGDYYIVAKHSLKALTAIEHSDGSVVLGQSVRKPGVDAAQLWNVTAAGDGSYRIRSKRYGTLLAEGEQNDNGDTGVALKPERSAGSSAWDFRSHLNSFGIELGRSGVTLNVTGASMDDDADIIVYDASEDENAQWLMYLASGERQMSRPGIAAVASAYDNLGKRYRIAALPSAEREAARLRRSRLMDYQPSGVYIKKGEAISIVAEGMGGSPDGLTVLIGPRNEFWRSDAHDDPQIVPVAGGRADFTATRSGLIYFLYADSGYNMQALPVIDVQITKGGRPVPLYVDGQISANEWRDRLAQMRDAPYVEIIGSRVAITATRDAYAKAAHGDPGEVLSILGTILADYDVLSGLDGSSPLHAPSPLRVHYQQDMVTPQSVWDEGIYMYASDYFIGVPGQYLGDLLAPDTLRNAWSIWHETGHKYQQEDWTWSEVTETTVNIYSLSIQEQFGLPSNLEQRDSDTGKTTLDLASAYLAKKRRAFNDDASMRISGDGDWNWIRLVMFHQLGEGLGPSFYPRLQQYYRQHPLAGTDLEDAGKVQAFVLRASEVSGVDLGRFFSDWGIPIEPQTADRLRKLGLPQADPGMSGIGISRR